MCYDVERLEIREGINNLKSVDTNAVVLLCVLKNVAWIREWPFVCSFLSRSLSSVAPLTTEDCFFDNWRGCSASTQVTLFWWRRRNWDQYQRNSKEFLSQPERVSILFGSHHFSFALHLLLSAQKSCRNSLHSCREVWGSSSGSITHTAKSRFSGFKVHAGKRCNIERSFLCSIQLRRLQWMSAKKRCHSLPFTEKCLEGKQAELQQIWLISLSHSCWSFLVTLTLFP